MQDLQDCKRAVFVVKSTSPLRLDRFLKIEMNKGLRYVHRLVKEGRVWVNGKRIFKKGETVAPGMAIEVEVWEREEKVKAPVPPVRMLQSQGGVGAVYKPPFWHTQRGKRRPCLEDWLERSLKGPFFLLNRLDYLTSGLVLYSITPGARSLYGKLQDEGKIEKYYFSFVHGCISSSMVVKNIIDHCRRKKVKVLDEDDEDKRRWSIITPLNFFKKQDISLVRVKILKGRRHQIRAHLSYISHPIVGDPLYGIPINTKRMYLCHYMIRSEGFCFKVDRELEEWIKRIAENRL